MFRKGLVCIIVVLFVGTSIVSAFNVNVSNGSKPTDRGNTLYVGGSGPGNYTKIQDAIDDANDGDKVFVYSKTYYENLIVDVSICLIGEDRNLTIIDGQEQGDVIKLTVDGIAISGFTIRKCNYEVMKQYGAIHAIETNNHIITNNKICENEDTGISFENSHYNVISGNYIIDNSVQGIWLFKSGNNIISNNIVENNGAGIWLQLTSSANNIIENNYIVSNQKGLGGDGASNIVYNNTIKNNTNGVDVYGNLNNITDNKVIDNEQNGFSLCGSDNYLANNEITGNYNGVQIGGQGQYNIINDNIIESNKNNGVYLYYGGKYNIIKNNIIDSNKNGMSLLKSGDYNVIVGNSLRHNKLHGIYNNASCRNIFCYNNISLNNEIGVYLIWNSINNIIKGNNFSKNLQSINISNINASENLSFNNNIFHNNFFNNEIQPYDEFDNSWDNGYPSGGNYWDDYNGTDADGDDIGDTPYNISGGDNQDRYPLMFPYVNQGAPDRPMIGGETSGKRGIKYNYTFITTDPDSEEVYYYIDWGDNTSSGWIGPYSSGVAVIQAHKWSKRGTYIIKAKAKDINGEESDWGTLCVTMPRAYSFDSLFLKFLARFLHAFQILQYLLKL